jgi:hypothetical protein
MRRLLPLLMRHGAGCSWLRRAPAAPGGPAGGGGQIGGAWRGATTMRGRPQPAAAVPLQATTEQAAACLVAAAAGGLRVPGSMAPLCAAPLEPAAAGGAARDGDTTPQQRAAAAAAPPLPPQRLLILGGWRTSHGSPGRTPALLSPARGGARLPSPRHLAAASARPAPCPPPLPLPPAPAGIDPDTHGALAAITCTASSADAPVDWSAASVEVYDTPSLTIALPQRSKKARQRNRRWGWGMMTTPSRAAAAAWQQPPPVTRPPCVTSRLPLPPILQQARGVGCLQPRLWVLIMPLPAPPPPHLNVPGGWMPRPSARSCTASR